MASGAALLNQIVAATSPSSPRKRQLKANALNDSPRKRQAVEAYNKEAQNGNAQETQKPQIETRSRKSVTQLPRRSSVNAPQRTTYRRQEGYEVPASPEATRKNIPQNTQKQQIKKPTRRLFPIKGKINTLASSKVGNEVNGYAPPSTVTLTSYDSPAKNTRAKSDPRARLNELQSRAMVQLPKGKAQESVPLSRTDAIETNTSMFMTDEREDQAQDTVSHGSVSKSPEPEEEIDGKEDDVVQGDTQPVKMNGSRKGKQKKKDQAAVATIEDSHLPSDTNEESENEEAESTQKKRGRPGLSKEQKKAQREAEQQKRDQDKLESLAAEASEFELTSRKFVREIEEPAKAVGGIESWSKIGGGAGWIRSRAGKKTEVHESTNRADSLLRTIRHIRAAIANEERTMHGTVDELLEKYRSRAKESFLCKQTAKRGDQTVVVLFNFCIPESIHLLRNFLRDWFDDSRLAWKTLRVLAKAAINLCDVASNWTPKPSTLESGTRGQVRNNLRPGLSSIYAAIGEHLDDLKKRELLLQRKHDLTKAQHEAKEKRRQDLQRIQARMSSLNMDPKWAKKTVEAIDIDDIEDDVGAAPTSTNQRQSTEEIPAPDPNIAWTTTEDTALLNGLQAYRDVDRYNQILQRYVELADKDVDQCIARARFYKQAWQARQIHAEEHGKDWLLSV